MLRQPVRVPGVPSVEVGAAVRLCADCAVIVQLNARKSGDFTH